MHRLSSAATSVEYPSDNSIYNPRPSVYVGEKRDLKVTILSVLPLPFPLALSGARLL